MAFEKIKVANPIVEMDGEISLPQLFVLLSDLLLCVFGCENEKRIITFTLPSFYRSFVCDLITGEHKLASMFKTSFTLSTFVTL